MVTAVEFISNSKVNTNSSKDVSNGTFRSATKSRYAELDASKCTFTPTTTSKPVPSPSSNEVKSQAYTTDHMLTVQWTEHAGWYTPSITTYSQISLWPTASVLHYATECFEGMKAYRGNDNKVRLFRPDRNAKRFNQSAARVDLPQFCEKEFVKLLKRYVAVEADKWIAERGQFVYIRPTMIATTPAIGVRKPQEALMYFIMVLFPALEDVGEKSVKGLRLLASERDVVRAWPNGCGNAKVGANYGPALPAHTLAQQAGYDQVLWLFGEENYITEAGGSNLFVLWINERGEKELVTAPLGDGLILPGVTRASVLELAREFEDVIVSERNFTIGELLAASAEERLLEAFGTGTAFFIAPVTEIHFRGQDVTLPSAMGRAPRFASHVKEKLRGIMYGATDHAWGVVVDETRSR